MKFTQYFCLTRERNDRKSIELKWIEETIAAPQAKYVQADGRIRFWRQIAQADNKWLRVVVLEDAVTVHNVFFDRSFKP